MRVLNRAQLSLGIDRSLDASVVRPVLTVSYAQEAPRRVANDRDIERTPRRDWKKTAMIIGGGASTIYETRK